MQLAAPACAGEAPEAPWTHLRAAGAGARFPAAPSSRSGRGEPGGLGTGRRRLKGPRLWDRRSGAVPTRAPAGHGRAPQTAAGRAADLPGSAELGSGRSLCTPTSSRPGARVREGRRRPRELEEGRKGGREGEAGWEELGARGEKEGSRNEKEEGVERTRRGGRFSRQSRGARYSARGRPASPSPRLGPSPARGLPGVCYRGVWGRDVEVPFRLGV